MNALKLELNLENNVIFHGRVSDEGMRHILCQADIGVNPDRPSQMNNISSMNKIVEYMALGLPIVQFDCIEGKNTALECSHYVESPDSHALAKTIFETLMDVRKREKMRTFGLARFKTDLCWEAQTPHLVAAYEHVTED